MVRGAQPAGAPVRDRRERLRGQLLRGRAPRLIPGQRDAGFFDSTGFIGTPGMTEHAPLIIDIAGDRKSTRLNSSHLVISYAVICLKTKTTPDSVTGITHITTNR